MEGGLLSAIALVVSLRTFLLSYGETRLQRARRGQAIEANVSGVFFENRRWFIDAVVDEIRPALHVAFVQRVTDRQKVGDRPKPKGPSR